jgi:hypothetical protein
MWKSSSVPVRSTKITVSVSSTTGRLTLTFHGGPGQPSRADLYRRPSAALAPGDLDAAAVAGERRCGSVEMGEVVYLVVVQLAELYYRNSPGPRGISIRIFADQPDISNRGITYPELECSVLDAALAENENGGSPPVDARGPWPC